MADPVPAVGHRSPSGLDPSLPDVGHVISADNVWEVAEAAWHLPAQRAHQRRISTKCLKFFHSTGLLTEQPDDVF